MSRQQQQQTHLPGDGEGDGNDASGGQKVLKDGNALSAGTFSFPRTFFGVGDIDPLLGDTLKVHGRMKAMFTEEEVPLEMHVYPYGFHGFYGMPPEWQLGFVEGAAKPCGEAVVRFLLRNATGGDAKEGADDGGSIGLRRGPRALQHEYFGLAMLVLFILMPMAVAGPPLAACWWLYKLV